MANHQFKIGCCLLLLVLLPAVVSFFSHGIHIEINMDQRARSRSDRFPLGTDDLGRDFLSSLVYGIFNSVMIGFLVVLFSSVSGMALGMVSGLAGGWVDTVIMRMVDVIMGFPGILLAIALASLVDTTVPALIGILTFSGWTGYARIIRGEVLKLKNLEFVQAAKSYNASPLRIILFHFPPLLLPLVIVQAFIGLGEVILVESGLNFLGIGLPAELPSLGQLIDAGSRHVFDRPGWLVWPGGVLVILVLGFNFLGEGLRNYFQR